MRKRTQLVGFEFGYWKHSQYCSEFLDNSLDAIESFQWNELKKLDSKIKFTLDKELSLENLSILQTVKAEKREDQPINEEAKHTLMQEFGIEPSESTVIDVKKLDDEEKKSDILPNESEIELEEEVQNIINDMEEIIQPVNSIIDDEPIAIIRLRESEASSFLTSELSQKNVMKYSFEIFDNGTGMAKVDLRKYGKYLASSKSTELKQTRGSQGFGAPSAFSDAQNTTGRPVVVVSKSADNVYAIVSEFFTTSKNEKKYLIHPIEIDSPFLHGTYIKLHYLNVKYVRGYIDTYIKETALMNPHITLIYIDPYNEEFIYPRKVSTFPMEPRYAKPHPSSTNIGDLQDLLAKTRNLTVSSFLKENFVRITSRIAKQILYIAERELQSKLNLFILQNGFLTIAQKKTDNIYFLRFEKKVFGKSIKERDKLIIYEIVSDENKNSYWSLIDKYNHFNSEQEKIRKQIRKDYRRLEKVETKKEEKLIEKEIKKLLKNIDDIHREKDKIKTELDTFFKNKNTVLTEVKKIKNRSEYEDLVEEVLISKAKPSELTNNQFNSLFLGFKSIKYMAPPTDTAIPVGDTILENTLIKEIGLKISDNLDNYGIPVNSLEKTKEIVLNEKITAIKKEDPSLHEEVLDNISVDTEEIITMNSKILSNLDFKENKMEIDQFKDLFSYIIIYNEEEPISTYGDLFEYFLENYTKDDDFVAGETRDPTSGKGLAYTVEAVLAYSKLIEVPKRSRDVLSRFVNRTPKLRDSADCAITKAVQSVNWKNYKLETYDNNLPKGPIKLLVNVSGPFVHLMFRSQSKNALADDEDLLKEIKYCLEAIGRKIRIYLNRKATLHKNEKRASLIEKYIPKFVKSVYNIAYQGESIYKSKINEEELITLMKEAIGKKVTIPPVQEIKQKEVEIKPKEAEIKKKEIKDRVIKKEESEVIEKIPKKEPIIKEPPQKQEVIPARTLNNWTIKELRVYCNEHNIQVPSKIRKSDIISRIQESYQKDMKIEIPIREKHIEIVQTSNEQIETISKSKISKVSPPKEVIKPKVKVDTPKSIQTQLPVITSERIIKALSDEWQTIKHLIFKLKIKDMMDARFLQIKLKELERKNLILVDIKMGKKYFKRK
ncbi:MAG: DNA topoisomerase VI subunit B [Promethearchaeota archaeon]